MNCRKFETLLPDWIGERLAPDLARQMEAHQAVCPACQRAALSERALRQRWQALSPPADLPDIWPRLSQRLVSPPAKRPTGFFSTWTLATAVPVAALVGLFFWTQSQTPTPPDVPTPLTTRVAAADERHLVQTISQIQQLPDEESDAFLADMQSDRQAQRRVLLGKE